MGLHGGWHSYRLNKKNHQGRAGVWSRKGRPKRKKPDPNQLARPEADRRYRRIRGKWVVRSLCLQLDWTLRQYHELLTRVGCDAEQIFADAGLADVDLDSKARAEQFTKIKAGAEAHFRRKKRRRRK